MLGPRIRRTLDVSRAAGTKRLSGPLLDALVEPALLLAPDLRIYGANAAAEALLRDGKMLRCGSAGQAGGPPSRSSRPHS
ncbi:hypothetical protein ACU4GR_13375 [Methylobacterium oryzae CBMB20]